MGCLMVGPDSVRDVNSTGGRDGQGRIEDGDRPVWTGEPSGSFIRAAGQVGRQLLVWQSLTVWSGA
jgi:hypothetical protein